MRREIEKLMSGKDLIRLMRVNKVTIHELSKKMGITMKRIREVRRDGHNHLGVIRDWVEHVTGSDPGENPLPALGKVY